MKNPVREEILGCIRQNAASRLREVNAACYSALESPYLGYFPSFLLPRGKKDKHTQASTVESHKGVEGTVAPLLWGKTDRGGTLLPADQKAQGESYQCI